MPWHGCACSREYPFQVDARTTGVGSQRTARGRPPGRPFAPARPCGHSTDEQAEGRCSARAWRPRPVQLATPSLPDLIRGGTSFRGDQHKAPHARPAHLCSRHQRPAGRPERPDPLRRARGRAPDRRGHGAGGQEAPSRTRLLRPAGPAPARRVPGPVRPPRRPHPDRGPRRDRSVSSSTTRTPACCPAGYRLGDNDSRILAVARNLQAEGYDVTVVSKDLPLASRRPRSGCSPRSTARSWPSPTPAGPEWPN